MISFLVIIIVSLFICWLLNFIPISPWFNFLWAILSLFLSILLYLLFILFFLRITKNTKPTGKFRYKLVRDIEKIVIFFMNVKIEIVGKEFIPNETFVCYANHKSNMDIILLHYALNRVCSAVGKKTLFRFPIIKQCQYTFGCIAMDRDNDRAAARSMVEAIKNVKNGLSYIIFPEGGIKSREIEEMVNLRAGAYKLVTKSQAMLLPCTIIGSSAFSKRKSIFNRIKVKIIFHKPMNSDEYNNYNTIEIGNLVMEIIKNDINNN